MDPDTKLAEMLRLTNSMLSDKLDSARAQRLADLVESMHNWIVNGGMLPTAWTPKHTALIEMAKTNEKVCACLGQGFHEVGSRGCIAYRTNSDP